MRVSEFSNCWHGIIYLFICSFFRVTLNARLQGTSSVVLNTKNIPTTEYDGLYDFYISLNGPNWHWSNISEGIPWNFSSPDANPCIENWQGIGCDCTSSVSYCYLTNLNLPSHNLSGLFPESVSDFSHLTTLILSTNNISGTISPTVLANITSLTELDLHNNQLVGEIPQNINILTKLRNLILSTNMLNGSIPSSLYQLSALESLKLQVNHFNGKISELIGRLTSLRVVILSLNELSGTIPSSIGNLTHLGILEIEFNKLKGHLPSSIGLLKNLSMLSLTNNYLSGPIPPELGNATVLTSINLDFNQFTGRVPPQLGNLTGLVQMFLNNNLLFGSLPEDLFNPQMFDITTVAIGNTLLSGNLPKSIQNWHRTLQFFYIGRNSMNGIFPISYFDSFSFRLLEFNANFFHGELPNPLPNSSSTLGGFNFGDNLITGSVPVNIWPKLSYYLAYTNYLSKSIPDLYENCQKLYYVDMNHNALTGTIPGWISQLPILTYLNFTENYLTGSINYTFSQVTHFSTLQFISLSYNFLTGTVPDALGRASRLLDIIMNNNELVGTIPQSFRSLSNLQVLFLQNNQMSGNLNNFRLYSLLDFDVSNNQFTGTLPDLVTITPSLQTFSASSNCLDGTIPVDYCVSSVTVLTLDGVSTASSCRTNVFPGSTLFNGFYVNSYLHSNIPQCLFAMPHIQTLHLSGNGLTGSLPSDLNISTSLTDLSLSHNQLSGTIPLLIQKRKWKNLDLSYNKFTGTISAAFHMYDNDSSLSLQINRLSGTIPSVLISAENINILQGNLFECSVDRSNLPQHDQTADSYSCGSDIVNTTIYIWLGVFTVFSLLTYFLIREGLRVLATEQLQTPDADLSEENDRRSSRSSRSTAILRVQGFVTLIDDLIRHFPHWRRTIENYQDEDLNTQRAINSIRIFLRPLRRFGLWFGLVTVIFFMPLYLGLSSYYQQYRFAYAWSVSAAFLTGSTPAVAMLVPLIISLLIAICYYRVLIENPAIEEGISYRVSGRFKSFLTSIDKIRDQMQYLEYISLMIVGVLNFLVMMIADIIYVYIIITNSTTVIIFAEIFLAVFKLWLNNAVLWKSIPWIRDLLKERFGKAEKNTLPAPSLDRSSETSNSPQSFSSASALPGVVSAAASNDTPNVDLENNSRPISGVFSRPLSSSRHESLFSISQVTTAQESAKKTYSSRELTFIMVTIVFNNIVVPIIAIFVVNPKCFYNVLFAAQPEQTSFDYVICDRFSNVIDKCFNSDILMEESSYTPPFIYGYACASNLLVNYVSVFIIMYIYEGFFSPIVKIGLKLVSDRLFQRAVQQEGGGRVRNSNVRKMLTKSSSLYAFISQLIPNNLKDFSPSPPNGRPTILFDQNRLAVKINSALVVLFSFGALFPPLAVVVCISITIITLYEEIVIGRLLYESKILGYSWYKKQLERDCYRLADTLNDTLWILIPVSSLLYSYIIFDTWGDQEGWTQALPATISMITVPFVTLVIVKNQSSIRDKCLLWINRRRSPSNTEGDRQMVPITVTLQNALSDVSNENGQFAITRDENTVNHPGEENIPVTINPLIHESIPE